MPKSKVSAFLSVLMVFVGGVAVGGLGYRLYAEKASAASVSTGNMPPAKKGGPQSPEDVRKRVVAHMTKSINLDDQQVGQLQRILDDTFAQFDQINKRARAEMDPVIEPFRKKADQQYQEVRERQIAKVRAMLRADQQPLYDKYLADRAAHDAERKKKQEQEHKDGKGPGPGLPPSRP